MMMLPGSPLLDNSDSFNAYAELEDIISIMVEAYNLETDVSANGFDPAVSRLLGEAETLWNTADARLQHLVRAPLVQGPCVVAAQHLFALLLSDGTDPGQDRQHLCGLASLAETLSLPNRTRAHLARVTALMSQVFADNDPFERAAIPFPLPVKDSNIQQTPH